VLQTFTLSVTWSDGCNEDNVQRQYVALFDFHVSLSPAHNYSAADSGAEYCDERVCLSVSVCVCLCVRDHIFGTTRPIFTKFFVHVAYGCGSVLLWQRYVMYFRFYE